MNKDYSEYKYTDYEKYNIDWADSDKYFQDLIDEYEIKKEEPLHNAVSYTHLAISVLLSWAEAICRKLSGVDLNL